MFDKIFHIPHCSTYIPDEFLSDFIISKDSLELESNIMSDLYIDKFVEDEKFKKIIFKYSRILCDVERYLDNREIMESVGMGTFYLNGHNLNKIRNSINLKLIDIYKNHHSELNSMIKESLKKFKGVLIIDLHSYPKEPLPYELKFGYKKRPEICLGINNNQHKNIIESIKTFISDVGLEYEINEPFSGSIIPDEYKKDKRVFSIMLDIRKDVYINNKSGFNKIKKLIYRINEKEYKNL